MSLKEAGIEHRQYGETLAATRRLTIQKRAELPPVIEQTLALHTWDGSQWVAEPSSSVDPATNTITATPNHLSLWAVLGETHRIYLPLVMRNR